MISDCVIVKWFVIQWELNAFRFIHEDVQIFFYVTGRVGIGIVKRHDNRRTPIHAGKTTLQVPTEDSPETTFYVRPLEYMHPPIDPVVRFHVG